MMARPKKNRRKQSERKWKLPQINWRALGISVAGVLGVCAAAGVVLWGLDQPIQTVTCPVAFSESLPLTSSES